MTEHRFSLEFDVRDYECDLQGFVNNAVYQHYLEHARHVYLRQLGFDFATLSTRGTNLVVIRVEIDYLHPLHSGDKFIVSVNTERISRLRFGYLQDIFRLPDLKPIVHAKVIGTAINSAGKPFLPSDVDKLFA
jgi:acyl-CoA thioester hydrolase